MNKIKSFFTHPLCLAGLAIFVVLLFTSTDDLSFIMDTVGGGLIIKSLNALIGALMLMALVRIAMIMRVLFSKESTETTEIKNDTIAVSILYSAIYLSMALVVTNSFG